jgi:hypothetical protein
MPSIWRGSACAPTSLASKHQRTLFRYPTKGLALVK